MPVSLKHTFQSAKTDSSDITIVQPSNWNEEHELTLATDKVLGRATAGTGAAEEISIGTALSISGGTLAVTNVPVANGGTGAATLTGVVKGNGTSPMTAGTVALASEVSGTLPVANGGTGVATLTANSVLIGNGTSAVTDVAPGAVGNLLTSDGTAWTSATPLSGPVIQFARQLVTQSTTTFTIPAGVTNIRLYACGRGGSSTGSTTLNDGAGGGGGGFGFGTLAVTVGQVIDITVSSGIATVARSGTTLITANPGGDASGATAGVGGTATISGTLTSSGAFTGGAGGSSSGGSGGSAGSPLGNGVVGSSGRGAGGAGIGGGGGGGGGGGAGSAGSGLRGGGAGSSQRGRVVPFTDPLLAALTAGPGSVFGGTQSQSGRTIKSGDGGPGAGGGGINGNAGGTSGFNYAGNGGFGGGGGGVFGDSLNSVSTFAGWGGALGGGGAAAAITTGPGSCVGGGSLAGGGAGSPTASGGPATVWIYY